MPVALRPIKPKVSAINAAAARTVVQRAMDDTAYAVLKDFQSVTQGWRNPPTFSVTTTPTGRAVGTDDEVFGYVDEGTEPHLISPKPGGVLRFAPGGLAKTSPGTLASRAGRPGAAFVFTRKPVRHPGTEARGFSKLIQRKREMELAKRIDEGLRAL